MKNFLSILLTFLLLFGISAPSWSGVPDNPDNNVGTYGLSILKIIPDARPAGMGQAFVGLSDDASALNYNIAGLGYMKYLELKVSQHEWLKDTRNSNLLFAKPTSLGTFGLNFMYFDEGTIKETRLDDLNQPYETGEELSSRDFSLQLGYAKKISKFAFGLGFRFISMDLAGETGSAISGDLGLAFKSRGFETGLSFQNLGPEFKFIEEKEKQPFTIRFGLLKRFGDLQTKREEFNVAVDALKQIDNKVKFHFGGEALLYKKRVAGRVGYLLGEDIQGFTVGMGFRFKDYFFDYAFTPISELDDRASHRFSLTWKRGYDLGEYGWEVPVVETKPIEIKREPPVEKKQPEAIEVRELPGGEILVTLRINFDFDKYEIRSDMVPILKQLADVLRRYPRSKVKIEGHTDSIGSLEYNIGLSQRRSESVRNYLLSKESFSDKDILQPAGYGKTRPIVPNTSAENRFINRRTDLIVYKEGMAVTPSTPTAVLDCYHRVSGKSVEVRIKLNGNEKIKFVNKLISPANDRHTLTVDIPEIYLLAKETTKRIAVGYVKQLRTAYHAGASKPDNEVMGYTRIAIDLSAKGKYSVFQEGYELVVRFE